MPQAETERFRKNLYNACLPHGAVQRIADSAGLSRVFVSRIIHGHADPSLDVAVKLAKAAGFSLGEMVEKSPKKLAAAG